MIEAPKVHVHMSVSNLEKSRAFYEKFLGVAPVKVKPGYVKFLPAFGPLNLALSQASPSSELSSVPSIGSSRMKRWCHNAALSRYHTFVPSAVRATRRASSTSRRPDVRAKRSIWAMA